jgi:hypothetical protein
MLELATNPATDPDILRKLSQSSDRAIRQAVAGNPNAPIEILWELAEDFPQEVTNNPILELLTLENPDWILKYPQSKYIQVLRAIKVFEAHDFCQAFSFLEIFAAHWHRDEAAWHDILHAFISIHPILLTEYLERIIIICNGNIGRKNFEQLYGSSAMTAECLINLAGCGGSGICHSILHAIADSRSILPVILQTQEFVELLASRMAKNTRISNLVKSRIILELNPPSGQVNSLFDSSSIGFLVDAAANNQSGAQLATRGDLVKEILIALVLNSYPVVRQNLLANTKIHADLLTELISHPDPKVREFVRQHPNSSK